MTFAVVTPELADGKQSAKDMVMSTLLYDHPLTLTKLTNRIKKRFNVSITFQGVRKAVNNLTEGGVIVKIEREYALDKEWIMRVRDFAEAAQDAYLTDSVRVKDIDRLDEDVSIYTFRDMIELDLFVNQLIGKWFDDEPGRTYLQHSGHAYFMVSNLEEETRILERIKDKTRGFYTLVGGNTPLDDWAKSYYTDQGFKYKAGSGKTGQFHAVYGDNIFQWQIPKELAKKIDAIYDKAKDFGSLDMVALIKLLRTETELRMTVMKNPVIAEQLRKSILEAF